MRQRPAIKSEASRCLCPFVGGPAIKGDAGFYGVCKRFKTPFKPPPREPPLTYRPGPIFFFLFFFFFFPLACLHSLFSFYRGGFVAVLAESGTGRARCGFKFQPCKICQKRRPYTRGAAPIIGYLWNTRTRHITVYVPKIRAATSEETSIPTSERRFSPAVSN